MAAPYQSVSVRRSSRAAFTLIEMVVVTAIVALMSALILPNLVAIQRSRMLRDEQAVLKRLPTEARNEAVKARVTVSLRVDGNEIVMERENTKTNEPESVKRVPVGNGFQVTGAQSGNDTSDVGSWKWQAFPDGTSDSGGLTFQVGSEQQSLWIPADGPARWVGADLPQTTDNSWPAGDLQQRTSTTTTMTGGGSGAIGGP